MFIRALAEDHGIKVVFGGHTPGYVRDEHAIYLPRYAEFTDEDLATDGSLAEKQLAVQDLCLGVAMHEIGHPVDTTPGWRNTGPLGDFLWNALEDIRVDSKRQRVLPGARRIFDAGYSRLIKMGWWSCEGFADLKSAFTRWILCRGRSECAEQRVFQPLADKAEAAVRMFAGDQFADGAWLIASRVGAASSTEDVFHIVEDLLAYLASQQQSPQSSSSGASSSSDDGSDLNDADDSTSPQSSQPQGGGQGDDDDSDTPSGDSQPSQGPEDTDGEDACDSGHGSSGTDDPTSPQSSQPQGGGQGDAGDSNTAPGASSSFNEPAGAAGDDAVAPGLSKAGNAVDDDSDTVLQLRKLLDVSVDDLPADVGRALAGALDDVSADAFSAGATEFAIARADRAVKANVLYAGDRDTRPLSMRIGRLLQAQSAAPVAHERVGSRIDSSLLFRVPLGEREVFIDEKSVRQVDTAIRVVVDVSSSMRSNGRIAVARAAALRLCIALSEVRGVCLSASAFPHDLDGRSDQVRELLPFGGKPRLYADNFLMLQADGGSTPLAEALGESHYALLRRLEPRKICVVLTDGHPNGGPARVVPIVERMRRSHIEVIGVGIQTMRYPDLFPKFEVVHDVNELESALFKLLQSTILKRAA